MFTKLYTPFLNFIFGLNLPYYNGLTIYKNSHKQGYFTHSIDSTGSKKVWTKQYTHILDKKLLSKFAGRKQLLFSCLGVTVIKIKNAKIKQTKFKQSNIKSSDRNVPRVINQYL